MISWASTTCASHGMRLIGRVQMPFCRLLALSANHRGKRTRLPEEEQHPDGKAQQGREDRGSEVDPSPLHQATEADGAHCRDERIRDKHACCKGDE